VVVPAVSPGMKEVDDLSCFRVPSGNVRAFTPIAVPAGRSKIF
jgi:hypothetical protein